MPEPVNLNAVIADMRARAEGWNGERYTMLPPDAVAALVAELDRLQLQEERLNIARKTLAEDGYFTDDQVGDDLAPRLIEWLSHHRGRMTATTRIEIDDDVLWARMLPRLERWADDRSRRDRAAFAAMPRMTW